MPVAQGHVYGLNSGQEGVIKVCPKVMKVWVFEGCRWNCLESADSISDIIPCMHWVPHHCGSMAGNSISQLAFSELLNWAAESSCLVAEVTLPIYFGLLSLGMKSLVYTVKLSTRAELVDHIMDVSMHIRNDKPSLMRSFTSLS
jgi:hypothetical protein